MTGLVMVSWGKASEKGRGVTTGPCNPNLRCKFSLGEEDTAMGTHMIHRGLKFKKDCQRRKKKRELIGLPSMVMEREKSRTLQLSKSERRVSTLGVEQLVKIRETGDVRRKKRGSECTRLISLFQKVGVLKIGGNRGRRKEIERYQLKKGRRKRIGKSSGMEIIKNAGVNLNIVEIRKGPEGGLRRKTS